MNSVHLLDDYNEMTARWASSYIGVDVDGVIKPFLVSQFLPKTKQGYFVEGDFNSEFRAIKTISTDKLVFDKPKLGVINYQDSSFLVSGIPRRQWKRGYRHTVVLLHDPLAHENTYRGKYFSDNLLRDYSFISNLFNPAYPSIDQCIRDVREMNALSRAFNHKFSICIRSGYTHPRVMYKGIDIGRLNPDNSVNLRKQSVHLFEELSQYLACNKG